METNKTVKQLLIDSASIKKKVARNAEEELTVLNRPIQLLLLRHTYSIDSMQKSTSTLIL